MKLLIYCMIYFWVISLVWRRELFKYAMECQQFQQAFGKALTNTTIFVPFLCATASQKILTHIPLYEDNVLTE